MARDCTAKQVALLGSVHKPLRVEKKLPLGVALFFFVPGCSVP